MKTTIKKIFSTLGYEVRKIQRTEAVAPLEMPQGIMRAKALGLLPNSVIDVGAAGGSWSVSAAHIWPEASFLLFEPLAERNAELSALITSRKNFQFIPAAAGKATSTISFYVADDLDGSGIATSAHSDKNLRVVDVVRIDSEVKRRNLLPPYVIKLDTHGFELPIIDGCEALISDVSMFIIECYGFQIAPNSLLFWEMCDYMDRLGFRLFDIVDIMRRKKDEAFWQCDAFFIRKDHPVFNSNVYE